jgi:predicted NBD/HSP70 family sugar kinase
MRIIGKPKLMREINRNLILEHMRNNKICTKTDLYKLTGLSKMTINNIVGSLIKKGIILESGYGNSSREGGKKPLLLKFNENKYYLIGIIVSDIDIRCGVTNLRGKIIHEESEPSDMKKGPDDVIERIVKIINKAIEQTGMKKNKFLGIGVGLPGIIDFENGTVNILSRFPEWKGIRLKNILNQKMELPVVIDNEVNVRALGEKWFGLGSNIANFITLNTTENGIGAGVIVNDELVRGFNYLCGEVGHVPVDKFDFIENNGNNENLESLLSLNQIILLIKKTIKRENNLIFKDFDKKENLKMNEIFEILNNNYNDNSLYEIIDKIANIFSLVIANVICTFDPELIIIHGKFSRLGDYFYDRIQNIIENKIFPEINKKINIERSLISKEMGIKGSASMVLDVINI